MVKVEIILKAMAALNLSTKNSNRGREIYLAIIRSRSVNIFLFSVSYETDSKSNMIKYYSFLSFPDKTASADFSSVSSTTDRSVLFSDSGRALSSVFT